MKLESIRVSAVIPAAPERIYRAWLDAEEHGAFTGGAATIEPSIGGRFTAWDGYIQGTTTELVPHAKIVQRWRSTDFPADAEDSLLVVLLAADPGGALVTIEHSEIPEGQGSSYEQGWVDHYFKPMKVHFTRLAKRAAAAAKAAASAPTKVKAAPKKTSSSTGASTKAGPSKRAATGASTKAGSSKKAAPKKAAPKKAAPKKTAPKKAAPKKAAPKKTAPKKTARKG